MREPDDGEGAPSRGRAETWGRASGHGQVYQSRANQYVTNIQLIEAQGQAAHEARQRADVVVQLLTRAVGEWAARCQELEEQVRRARSEGRAQAQAEFAEKLQNAELRVMQAQRTMRQAEEERARAEKMLAQAQQELARRRREAQRERDPGGHIHAPVHLSADPESEEQFTALMERAETEIGAVREELRQLGQALGGADGAAVVPQVIEGEWERATGTEPSGTPDGVTAPDRGDEPAPLVSPGEGIDAVAAPRPAPAKKRTPVPGPPRPFLILVAWLVCLLPPWVPMLAVTTNRAAVASDASLWGVVPFGIGTVLVAALVFIVLLLLAGAMTLERLDRDSETAAAASAFLLTVVGALVLLVAGFFTPLDWPGPAGGWGRALASFVGFD